MSFWRRYDTYFFDCDGVILQSNKLKIEAMREVAGQKYPKVADDFCEYAKTKFGNTRHEIFSGLFTDVMGIDVEPDSLEDLLASYSNSVVRLYMDCPMVDGMERVLTEIHPEDSFVVSGSREDELVEVFQNRDLRQYFQLVLGAPVKKSIHIHEVLSQRPSSKSSVLFGDSYADLIAAQKNEIDFVFIEKYSMASLEQKGIMKERAVLCIPDWESGLK